MRRYLWKQIIVLALGSMISFFSVYSLPAYLPQLVHHLGSSKDNIGYKVGAANNVMFAAAVAGALAAGILPYYISPKRLLVVILLSQGVFCIFYGFSNSLTHLFITLGALGVLEGAASVCFKTVISSKCTESSQSYILQWTISGPATITSGFAPALAGYLSFPTEKYPWLFPADGVFKMYPILLFQLVIGVSLILLSLTSYQVLDDEPLYQEHDGQELYPNTKYTALEDNFLENNNIEESHNSSIPMQLESSTNQSKIKCFIDNILLNRCCIGALIVKALYLACDEAYVTVVPIWLQTPRSNFGRNYNSNDSSNILIISGAMTALANYTVLGKINTLMNPKLTLSMWITVVAVLITVTPTLSCITDDSTFFIIYVSVNIAANVFASGGYTPVNVMLQNSVPMPAVAMMWSFSTFLTRAMEGFMTNIATSLFAWSIQNDHPFPLDYHAAFYFLAMAFLITFLPTAFIRSNIQQRLH